MFAVTNSLDYPMLVFLYTDWWTRIISWENIECFDKYRMFHVNFCIGMWIYYILDIQVQYEQALFYEIVDSPIYLI